MCEPGGKRGGFENETRGAVMLYALLMLATLGALIGFMRGEAYGVPLFILALIATAYAFIADITDPLTISL